MALAISGRSLRLNPLRSPSAARSVPFATAVRRGLPRQSNWSFAVAKAGAETDAHGPFVRIQTQLLNVLQDQSQAAPLQHRAQVDVHAVASHPDALRQYIQKPCDRTGKPRKTSHPGELQHEHGTVGQRWLPLDEHTDVDRREERWAREHELHVESVAGERADMHFPNRARWLHFGGEDLIEQAIGHPNRRLRFTADHIREADPLLLSDQLEYSVSIHETIVPLCFTSTKFQPILTVVVALRKVILVVEDDEELRRMFRTSLLLEGYEVLEARDGLEALTRIDRDPPDLVVLDLMLPSLSGIAVRQEIAAHVLTREIPIVVVTGSAMNIDHLDVECVLRKPIPPEALVAAVKRCFHRGAPGVTS